MTATRDELRELNDGVDVAIRELLVAADWTRCVRRDRDGGEMWTDPLTGHSYGLATALYVVRKELR